MAGFLVSSPASGSSRAILCSEAVAATAKPARQGERVYALIQAVQAEMLKFDRFANTDPAKWGERAWTCFDKLLQGKMTVINVASATTAYQQRLMIDSSLIARL